ncbi:MAG: hypothetical protein HW376_1636 [candidate division NC10 bacterium]|nr:hypothetical protein [candidate division NC10 bacterium]
MSEYVNPFIIFVVSVAGAGIGAYIGAYLREKGKNLATHEDIDRIVVQLRKTTEAAEDIKAQISGELWVKQRRWDAKWQCYSQIVENLGEVHTLIWEAIEIREQKKSSGAGYLGGRDNDGNVLTYGTLTLHGDHVVATPSEEKHIQFVMGWALFQGPASRRSSPARLSGSRCCRSGCLAPVCGARASGTVASARRWSALSAVCQFGYQRVAA